jgi:hypothetical protein
MAPMGHGTSQGPAPFGRTPGSIAEPAAGFILGRHLPVGHPRDASSGPPLIAPVQRARARVATSPRATIQARAGEWACHDTAWHEAWHQQGILTGGLAVMAYHAATLVRIHESRLSKQARAFRQRLRVRCRTVSQCNASINESIG